MKIGSVPATIMVVTLVVVAALLYFLTREDPQESDVIAPPVGTETTEPPPADDDRVDRDPPQEPTGESETADPAAGPSEDEVDADEGAELAVNGATEGMAPADESVPIGEPETDDPAAGPSEGELDADEDAKLDVTGEPEGMAPADESVPTGKPETDDPVVRPPEGELDADDDVEQDGAKESDGTASTGEAESIEPGLPEDTTATIPDPTPAIDQPADGVAKLEEPVSDPDVSVQPTDPAEMADRLARGGEPPLDSEVDPCDGVRAVTDDADAAADGAVPCPDESGAPADTADAVPESRTPADGEVADDLSGEGAGDEVPEDAGEAAKPAGASDAPAGEVDIAPESQALTDGQVADGASGEGTGDQKPDSEVDPCDGVRAVTDDADAVADGAVPCPDETGVPAGEMDTAPESRAQTDEQIKDGAPGEGIGDEVTEGAGEAEEPSVESDTPAGEPDTAPDSRAPADGQVADGASGKGTDDKTPDSEVDPCDGIPTMTDDADAAADGAVPCPDETGVPAGEMDTEPESRSPTDEQIKDGAPGEGAGDEVPEDAGEAEEPPVESDAPVGELDTIPDSQAPADGQVADGASGEGTGEAVPEETGQAMEPVGETGETPVEPLPEVQGTLPDAEESEPVEMLSTMEDQACPDDRAQDPLDEVGTDGRSPCPDEIPEAVQPDVESEQGRQAPTEPDAGSEMATDHVPEESAEDGEDDVSAPPEPPTEADEGPAPDGTADAVTPEGTGDVGTAVVDEADSGDDTTVSDDTRKEPADGASEPSPDPVQTTQPASERLGDSVGPAEIDDGSAGDVGSASGLPEEKMESAPETKEIVGLEASDEAPASPVAEITEDTAIDGESPVAESIQEDLTPPSFDLVRVDRFGTTVLAGRAPVDSLVEALVDGEVAGSQPAGRIGQFAMIFSVDTQRETLAIGLRATLPDGRSVDSDSSVFVVVPHGRMVPVNPVVEDGAGIESIDPVELPTTKLADLEGLQPSVLLATNEGVRLIQPSDPADEGKLLVEIVSYDEQGEVFIAGSTRTDGGRINILLNGELVKSTEISPGGSWWTDLKGVEPGRYRLRVEEMDQSGTIVASVEMPFQKESPEHAREMLTSASRSMEAETTGADQGPIISLLAVQRGFTLWGISRKQYGLGRLYVNIFEANRDQIDNPHLIYPGQIFILPHESQLVDPFW